MSEFTGTATNVEEDAMQLTQIFSKAANAIVEASNLRKEVAAMHEQINSLSKNVDELRASNDRLVEELSAIRQEKADVQNKLWDAEHQINVLKQQLETATRLNAEQGTEIAKHKETINQLEMESDDHLSAWRRAEDKVSELRDHIDRMQEAYEHLTKAHSAFESVVFPPKPAQEVKEVPASDPLPSTAGGGSKGPFENGSGTVTSGTAIEQPRDELNRFEPMPMAAKDFEF